jgi:hypothetical protein
MLLTFAISHARADLAKKVASSSGIQPSHPEYERTWKALAIMIISYDECGRLEKVEGFCRS